MIWPRLSRCAPLHLLSPIPHQHHRRMLARNCFFIKRGRRDHRERRPTHANGMHRGRKREYGHREHRGGRDMGGERDRDRDTGTRSAMATGIDSGTRDRTICEETMTVAATLALVVGVVRGSSRSTDGTTTGAVSSSAMTNVDTVVGAKLVEAIEVGGRPVCQKGGRRLQRGVSRCRSADARLLDGTSMHWGTSNTRLCKRNKLVDTTGSWFRRTCLTLFYRVSSISLALTVLRFRQFLVFQVYHPRCPSGHLEWAWAAIRTCPGGLEACTHPMSMSRTSLTSLTAR